MATVDRREVELEVAGVDDRALGCEVRDRETVRNRVRDRDELTFDRPDAPAFTVEHRDELGAVEHPRFFDAIAGKRQRQRGAVDRYRDVPQEERKPARVILVRVREDDRLDAVCVFAQIREVRQDEIDARHVGIGKHDPAVDDQYATVDLEAEAIPAYLAEAAEEHDSDRHQARTLQRAAPQARRCSIGDRNVGGTEPEPGTPDCKLRALRGAGTSGNPNP